MFFGSTYQKHDDDLHMSTTMKKMLFNINSLCVLTIIFGSVRAFNFPTIPTIIFNPPSRFGVVRGGAERKNEVQLLKTIKDTGNGKNADIPTQVRVLSIVRQMETLTPPSPTLLSNLDEAKSLLDGEWYLQYTAPSEIDGVNPDDKWVAMDASEGESNIETRQFNTAGSVSGGGIPVDASSTVAVQSFDVDNSRVKNVITTGIGVVTVGGTYSQSPSSPLRAVVAFDTAKIDLTIGLTVDLSFLFDIRAAVKGSRNAGWLETTYVSKDVRIGRGNKGSVFILTRDRDALQ